MMIILFFFLSPLTYVLQLHRYVQEHMLLRNEHPPIVSLVVMVWLYIVHEQCGSGFESRDTPKPTKKNQK